MKKLLILVLLLSGCATNLPNKPNTWEGKVRWDIVEYPDLACRLAGTKSDTYIFGCHYFDRDGTHHIITGEVKSLRNLQTVGEELTHAAFGDFHGNRHTSDELLSGH